jgi:parallel beta helix pectate lyase-like protein
VSIKLAENGVSRGGLAAAVAAIAAYAVLAFAGAPAAFAAGCARIAATNGSDSAAGTQAQPFRSAQKLVDSLAAGETGCLRAGTYSGNVKVSRSGTSGAPITLTSFPGERATVSGKLWIDESANFITVSSLDLDGRNAGNLASPAINGDDVTFVGNDVTNHNTTICFSIGPTTYGRAYRTVIQGNRIHNCGELPATNLDHGIYVEHSTAARIVDNVIYDNADRGVQLYPDAQSSYVARNIIDGNGEGVTIAGGSEDYGAQASNDNVVEQNVITNSVQRYNVESHWGSPVVGQRNFVRQNCVFGGARDGDNHGLSRDNGFTSSDNLLADPRYVNRAAKDFTLSANSPCRDLASYRTPAAAVVSIVLSAPSSARTGTRVPISGRVTGPKRPRRITLRTRNGKRWKKVKSVRVDSKGHFKVRTRLRKSSRSGNNNRRKLVLQAVKLSGNSRTLKLKAVASGIGSSNTVKVRVRR